MPPTKIIASGVFDNLWLDVRQVLRQIHNSVAFSAIVILLLAAGLGVGTAIFSAVRTVLLSSLPYKNSEQLVQVISQWLKTGDKNDWNAPYRDALDWKTSVTAFRDVGMYRYTLLNLTESAPAESLYGVRATAGLLPLLGVRPYIGQWFSSDDDRPGHTHVLVLSYDLWRRRFQADSQIVGKVVHLNGEGYQVIGVMPKGFNFPLKLATTAQLPTDQMQFWMPLGTDLAAEEHGAPNAGVIARLNPGISLPEAQSQLEAACLLLQSQFPATNKDLSREARVSARANRRPNQCATPCLACGCRAYPASHVRECCQSAPGQGPIERARIGSAHGPGGQCHAGRANPSASGSCAFSLRLPAGRAAVRRHFEIPDSPRSHRRSTPG
jgi:hypothetical protein